MSKYIVLHHAHHPNEDVYRLIYARVVESTGLLTDADGNVKEVPVKDYVDHTDIIWSANDERWKNRSIEEIANEQRSIVKATLDKRTRDEIKAQEEKSKHVDLGSKGHIF